MRNLQLITITMLAIAISAVHARSGALDLRLIEGDYKLSFQSQNDGEKIAANDTLRIVRHGPDAVYFSLGLEFLNGHTCFLDGIAAQRGSELISRKPIMDGRECRMRIVVEDGTLKFHDEGRRCQFSCGARGGYSGAGFRLSLRRPLRNVAAFRPSDEFRSAVKAYEALPPETASSQD